MRINLLNSTTPDTPDMGYTTIYADTNGVLHILNDGQYNIPIGPADMAGGRLTLASGTPVTTTDQTAKTTLYYTPYLNNFISLYDGVQFKTIPFVETALSLTGLTANTNYDIFAYLEEGTFNFVAPVAWTNATTRATALAYYAGKLSSSANNTHRYLGTIRTTGTTGQCEDSLTKRFVWNYYNRVGRDFYRQLLDSHGYNTATWRPWNNSTTNRLEFVIGAQEGAFSFNYVIYCTGGTGLGAQVMMALDGTTSSELTNRLGIANNVSLSMYSSSGGSIKPIAGHHYIQPVQYTNGGTPTYAQLEMMGVLEM